MSEPVYSITIKGEMPYLRDPAGAMPMLAQMMEDAIHLNFKEGGRPNKWTPKRNGQPSHLRGSGELEGSIESTYGNTFAQVSAGEGLPYGWIHQLGGTIKHPGSDELQVFEIAGQVVFTRHTKPHDITIKARPYVVFTMSDMDRFGQFLCDFVVSSITPSTLYGVAGPFTTRRSS